LRATRDCDEIWVLGGALMNWRCLVLLLGMGVVQSSSGAWLGICSDKPSGTTARLLAEYISPQKERTALLMDATPLPECTAVEIPFALESVVSGTLLSSATGAALKSGFALTGSHVGQQFKISDIAPDVEKADTGTIPLDVELIDQLGISAFSAEGRASASRSDGHITLECSPGHRPAGMVLHMPFLGLAHTIPLSVSVSYVSNGTFETGLSDARRTSIGDPLTLARLRAATASIKINVPRHGLDSDLVESFTIACPQRAARFELTSLQIKPKTERTGITSRASWIWQPDTWMNSPEALLDKFSRAGVGTLFVTIPINSREETVEHPNELKAFVNAATKRGMKIWAVVGDPGAVIESERAVFARYPAAYADYNANVPSSARLGGIQFDIEPYLNAGYTLNPAVWCEAYLDTLRQLKQASALPIEVDVPFWWVDQQTANGSLLDRLASVVDGVTVMNYRTDPVQIKHLAQPFLEWGMRHKRRVRIALESGPIPDEIQRHYHPARSGDMALVSVGSNQVLLAFDRMQSFPESSATVQLFQLSHATPVPGSATTFAGQHDALLKLLPDLEKLWGAWSSFAGTALHEFEP